MYNEVRTKKEPPDKYRCLKHPISSIILNNEDVQPNIPPRFFYQA
jgi:hypothetical protein